MDIRELTHKHVQTLDTILKYYDTRTSTLLHFYHSRTHCRIK
jgi:hypothetical protein